jgi:hypothetical protein
MAQADRNTTTIKKNQQLVELDAPGMTFVARLEHLRAVNAQAHYDAALRARIDFEDRLVRAVRSRVEQVLDAITAD